MVSDEIRWWVEASEDDARASLVLKEKQICHLAVFHAQQAAEKALKAMCLKNRRPGFSHSCVDLLKKIAGFGIRVPERVMEAARRLDPHYIMARYPNGMAGSPKEYYDQSLADQAQIWMNEIMKFVEL